MERLFLFLRNPFAFSEERKKEIFKAIEFYEGGISYCASRAKELSVDDEEIDILPPLLKISSRYVLCKRCLAHHLSELLGRKIFADEISDMRVSEKYSAKILGHFIFYYDVETERVYMAKKKHFGLYVQHYSRKDPYKNFFCNL